MDANQNALDKYLSQSGMSNEAFGDEIGVSGEAVRKYREGLRNPRDEIKMKIEQATGGAVSLRDLVSGQAVQ